MQHAEDLVDQDSMDRFRSRMAGLTRETVALGQQLKQRRSRVRPPVMCCVARCDCQKTIEIFDGQLSWILAPCTRMSEDADFTQSPQILNPNTESKGLTPSTSDSEVHISIVYIWFSKIGSGISILFRHESNTFPVSEHKSKFSSNERNPHIVGFEE